MQDDEVIQARQRLVESSTPGELGAIRGFSDFPVPTLFKSRSRSNSVSKEKKKRSVVNSTVPKRHLTVPTQTQSNNEII